MFTKLALLLMAGIALAGRQSSNAVENEAKKVIHPAEARAVKIC
jgi:hypothetical protein